jgi:hypothetical protein
VSRALARALTLLLPWLLAGPAPALDVTGAWHLLVHYRDLRSAQPELPQWEDRLIVLEPDGDGLRFRDYPIVRFEDAAGRFESLGGEPARVLAFWEPSAAQRAEIERGLRVDARGATEKRLRPVPGGWSSRRARAGDSLRFVGFESVVELDVAGPAPRLVVTDTLGSAAAQAAEGRTEYRGERVSADGRSIEGRYERDGRRVGSFRMTRAGPPRGLGDEPAPARASARGDALRALARALGPRLAASEALPERFAGGPAERAELRARVRAELDAGAAAAGSDPRAVAPELDRLARAVERLYADDGRSREEIARLLADGKLGPGP